MASTSKRKPRQSRKSDFEEEAFSNVRKLLGFPPIAFIDAIINSANDSCCDAIDQLEEFLIQTLANVPPEQITNVCIFYTIPVHYCSFVIHL